MPLKYSKQDLYIKALEARGYVRQNSKSRKFICLNKEGQPSNVFVGRAGSVRIGRKLTASVPLSDKKKAQLLEEGQTQTVCTYPDCKCIVQTSTTQREPKCPKKMEE